MFSTTDPSPQANDTASTHLRLLLFRIHLELLHFVVYHVASLTESHTTRKKQVAKNPVPSIINHTELATANVVYLLLPFDRSSGLAGAEHGPEAIRHILDTQIEFFEPITETTPIEYLRITHQELKNLHACSAEKMVRRVYQAHQMSLFMNVPFVIGLGGDHSVSIGIFKSIARKYRGKDLPTIVQIDAHFDLRESDVDFRNDPVGIYAHCSVMRRAAELGFPIVSLGIRSFSREELAYVETHKQQFSVYYWNRVRHDHEPPLGSILHAIKTRDVYLTIDVDGIDPSHMPATGTPVQNGLGWAYTIDFLNALFRHKNVIGMDIVEVAPPLGETNLTAYGAAQLSYMCVALKYSEQLKQAPPARD